MKWDDSSKTWKPSFRGVSDSCQIERKIVGRRVKMSTTKTQRGDRAIGLSVESIRVRPIRKTYPVRLVLGTKEQMPFKENGKFTYDAEIYPGVEKEIPFKKWESLQNFSLSGEKMELTGEVISPHEKENVESWNENPTSNSLVSPVTRIELEKEGDYEIQPNFTGISLESAWQSGFIILRFNATRIGGVSFPLPIQTDFNVRLDQKEGLASKQLGFFLGLNKGRLYLNENSYGTKHLDEMTLEGPLGKLDLRPGLGQRRYFCKLKRYEGKYIHSFASIDGMTPVIERPIILEKEDDEVFSGEYTLPDNRCLRWDVVFSNSTLCPFSHYRESPLDFLLESSTKFPKRYSEAN